MITVIDSPCGAGKTSFIIQKLKNEDFINNPVIYITPYLNEVKRIKEACPNREFHEPNNQNRQGSKLASLKTLMIQGKDICSTHALFHNIDAEVINILKSRNYTLVMDEVMDVIKNITISKDDFDMLVKNNIIAVNKQDNKVVWFKPDYNGKFMDIKRYAENDNLYLHSVQQDDLTLLVWTFPIQLFNCIKDTYILTYLFDGQIQKYYYDMFQTAYIKKSVNNINGVYHLVDYIHYTKEDHSKLRELIHIYEGDNLNAVGSIFLSKKFFLDPKSKKSIEILKNNTYNFFRHINKAKSNEVIYTTLKNDNDKPYVKVPNYSKGFVSCNARATNEYSERRYVAYLLDRFLNPLDKSFFKERGVVIDENLWALSELIQFIWRSRIRKGESIELYIPSQRMRNLLKNYLRF